MTLSYLATVIDLTSRSVVGWATADHLRTDLVDQALGVQELRRGVDVVEAVVKPRNQTGNRRPWATRAAVHKAIFNWIEGWYNTRRRHSTLDYLSRAAYEARITPHPVLRQVA